METKLHKINTDNNCILSFYETTGFSMWPFITQGEKLIIKKVPMKDLKTGDIILYRANNQMVCHRLVKKIKNKEGYLFYARGDNSLSSAEPVIKELLVGKVAGVLRKGQIITLTGRWHNLVNRLIIVIGPLFGICSRIIKRGLRYM